MTEGSNMVLKVMSTNDLIESYHIHSKQIGTYHHLHLIPIQNGTCRQKI